jgi:polar amino acid transport system substrate-binding protein
MLLKKKSILAVLTSLIMALSLALIGCGGTPEATDGDAADAQAAGGDATPTEMILVKEGKLIVGSDCDYPPFIFMDGAKPAGFEYDLMLAIGDKLGLEVEYLAPQNFDSLIASVAAGSKMDIGVSSFTINDERKKLVNFCTPYFDSNQAIVSLKSKAYTNASDLEGMVIAAQSGTTGADWAQENIPGITLKPFNQTSEAIAAVLAGDAEAVVYDEPVAAEHVAEQYAGELEIIQSVPTGEQYGFAVSKDNPVLEAAVNQALLDLKADGTFDLIFLKYFPGVTPPSLR